MMLESTSISERRACALVGLSRDSWRHPPQRVQQDQKIGFVDLGNAAHRDARLHGVCVRLVHRIGCVEVLLAQLRAAVTSAQVLGVGARVHGVTGGK